MLLTRIKLHVRDFPDDCFFLNIDYLRLTYRVEQFCKLSEKWGVKNNLSLLARLACQRTDNLSPVGLLFFPPNSTFLASNVKWKTRKYLKRLMQLSPVVSVSN